MLKALENDMERTKPLLEVSSIVPKCLLGCQRAKAKVKHFHWLRNVMILRRVTTNIFCATMNDRHID